MTITNRDSGSETQSILSSDSANRHRKHFAVQCTQGAFRQGCPTGSVTNIDKFVSHPILLFSEVYCYIKPSVTAYAVPPPLVRRGLRSVLPVKKEPLQSAP